MKKFVLIAISMAFAVPALATHAYRTENCVSTTHKLVYNGNYPLGGSYSVSKLNSSEEVEIWDKETSETEDNQFEVVRSKVLSSRVVKAKCSQGDEVDFEETFSKIKSVIKFNRLSKEDEIQSGIKSGTVMVFTCKEVFSVPVRCEE